MVQSRKRMNRKQKGGDDELLTQAQKTELDMVYNKAYKENIERQVDNCKNGVSQGFGQAGINSNIICNENGKLIDKQSAVAHAVLEKKNALEVMLEQNKKNLPEFKERLREEAAIAGLKRGIKRKHAEAAPTAEEEAPAEGGKRRTRKAKKSKKQRKTKRGKKTAKKGKKSYKKKSTRRRH